MVRTFEGASLAMAPAAPAVILGPSRVAGASEFVKIARVSRTPDPLPPARSPLMRTRILRGECLRSFCAGLLVAAGLAGVAADASAQTPFVPYFGKNQIRYDNFR